VEINTAAATATATTTTTTTTTTSNKPVTNTETSGHYECSSIDQPVVQLRKYMVFHQMN
jgi:hypothetical protein